MDSVILPAGLIAAAPALAGLALALRWRRPDLLLEFARDWSASPGSVTFFVRAQNRGHIPLCDVRLVGVVSSSSGSEATFVELGRLTLLPAERREIAFPVSRPEFVEVAPGDRLIFKARIGVIAQFGEHRTVVYHRGSGSAGT